MPSFNPRVWLRDIVRTFPAQKKRFIAGFKAGFIAWFNAPSLREVAQQQERNAKEWEKSLSNSFDWVYDRISALEEKSKALNRRLSALETPASKTAASKGSDAMSEAQA